MFQSYEPVSDISFAGKHLPLIRREMEALGLDGFVLPHDDEYQNEYVPEYAERLTWASGFSGSAGAAIILIDRAIIFTDGRYTQQVRQQADPNFFEYVDLFSEPPHQWLSENAKRDTRIGYDPMLHTPDNVAHLRKAAKNAGFTLVAIDENPVDKAWTDQPAKPSSPARAHDLEFAGRASSEKRKQIGKALEKVGVDATLLTAPPSIAWLLNIRGSDVSRTPIPLARAIVNRDGSATLFIAPEKIDNALPEFLGSEVDIRAESDIDLVLQNLGSTSKTIGVDFALTPSKFVDALKEAGAAIINMTDPCALPRAEKNTVEIDGTRNAHIRDGAIVTRFLHWMDTEGQTGDIDEITAAKKLEELRCENKTLRDISFDTISGAGPNGSLPHYRVTTQSNRKLERGSLYLVDSGGQYPDGTTDITRTMPIGDPTDEMRERFTLVLKGHIGLAMARFPVGTTGTQLDSYARKPLWDAGLDYDHGTGHGVGSFLGVHEGPQRIAKSPSAQALKPGMIISNEPGYYKSGEYGIRIENLVVVSPGAPIKGGEREMMSFETVTLAPIHLGLIDKSLLTEVERNWLNEYHAEVRAKLSSLLPVDIKDWFEDATQPI